MNTTIEMRRDTFEATEPALRRQSGLRPGLIGGIGGLVFAGGVLAQNALRAKFPANDVGAAEVMKYYTDHRAVTLTLAVLMPIGLVALTTFLGTLIARVVRGAGRAAGTDPRAGRR